MGKSSRSPVLVELDTPVTANGELRAAPFSEHAALDSIITDVLKLNL